MTNHRTFNLFPYLSDDLKHSVISFVADAPLEEIPDNYKASSLTHDLPAVSKRFREFAQSDLYWKGAIARQAAREPMLWRRALNHICLTVNNNNEQSRSVVFSRRQHVDNSQEPDQSLIERTHTTLGKPSYQSIYKTVVNKHLRFKGPVLCRAGHAQLGHPYEMTLTLPGHVIVVQDALRDHPIEALEGAPIDRDALFIHANRGPLQHATPALLVQILRCASTLARAADDADNTTAGLTVILLPVAHVWLEQLWVGYTTRTSSSRPSGQEEEEEEEMGEPLVYGQCLQMTKHVAADMNRLARNEALASVMDQLAGDLFQQQDDDDDEDDEEDDDDDMSFDSEDESFYLDDGDDANILPRRG